MKVKVTVIEPSQQYTNKAGKLTHRAACTFTDDGARYLQGRGICYSNVGSFGPGSFEAFLVSYDHGSARFAVRENR